MSTATLNADLLRRVMEHIEAHPEQHDQRAFGRRSACGTTYCFAGWAVLLSDPEAEVEWTPVPAPDGFAPFDQAFSLVDGTDIEDLATELLGLTREQAVLLFYTAGTTAKLRTAVDCLLALPRPVAASYAP